MKEINIVLHEPEIPQNTGNIARTCAATRTELILIEPLGFQLSDKYMKRAGLDYFSMVDIRVLPSFEALLEEHPDGAFHFATTKAPRSYTEAVYGRDDFLVFGCETKGLPESLLKRVYDRIRLLFPNAKVIFATSTSVVEEWANPDFCRYNHEIEQYNQKAREVMQELGVQVNDLYAVSSAFDNELHSDWVHFGEEGSKLLADAVVKACME